MTVQRLPRQIRVQELNSRKVVDERGNPLGRVYEITAERDGQDLRVTEVLVGKRAWPIRFGWGRKNHELRVPWDAIVALEPEIVVKRDRVKQG